MEINKNTEIILHDESLPNRVGEGGYIHAATSDNTRKAYQQDIRHFIAWGGLLPTISNVVLRYLEQHATILNARTLVRRLTALKNWHTYQGFADPTAHPVVRKTMIGIKNTHGKPKEKAAALTLETLIILCEYLSISNRLIDLRNKALILIGFFGAFRRSELVTIQFEQIQFVKEGIEILIPRSKTDQGGEGQVCAIPYGNEQLCAVTVLKEWLAAAKIEGGAVFRMLHKNNAILENAISPQRLNLILKSIATKCNLSNPENYSGHSLRRGFATTASKKGAPFQAIMRQGRWRHEGTVLGYIEEGTRFEGNAAGIILCN